MSFLPRSTVSVIAGHALDVAAALPFVQHKSRCAWTNVMDDKGPCDCGLKKLIDQMPLAVKEVLANASVHVRELVYADLNKELTK